MPRRIVRPVHREVDLEGRLLEFDDLPQPWDEGLKIFGQVRPLEVEVGSGKGLFLRRATEQRPEHNFLGLEISHKYARYSAALLTRDQRDNARIMSGDGLRVFRDVLPDSSLEAVHVYFPDPWWKKRHRKRRVLNEAFLKDVARTLRSGGELHFWTDVQEYFETTLELIDSMKQDGLPLEGPHEVPEPPSEHHLDFHTHFERRTRLNEQPVYRSRFVRS